MLLKLLKDLQWSPDGCVVVTIPAGDYPPEEIPECAQVIAGQLGIIEKFADGLKGDNIPPEPEPEPEPVKKSRK